MCGFLRRRNCIKRQMANSKNNSYEKKRVQQGYGSIIESIHTA